MCTRNMIDFYVESVSDGKQERTLAHHSECLVRMFTSMEPFGITIQEESIDGLTGANVQRWFNNFKKDKKPTTINNYVVTLNPFLRWAHVIYPEIPDVSNVLHCVKLPDPDKLPVEERPKDKYYTDEEISRLLAIPKRDSVMKKRNRAIIALFCGSGLRVSELCSLTVGDIDNHDRGSVYVRRKGGAWKNVEIADFAYDHIERYLRTREDRDDAKAPLFMTSHGTPCNRQQIYEAMKTCQDKAGVSDNSARGCHVFRHSFVSAVEKIGGGAVARDLANHKSLVITNRYDHSTAQQRRDAVNALRW